MKNNKITLFISIKKPSGFQKRILALIILFYTTIEEWVPVEKLHALLFNFSDWFWNTFF